MRPLAKQARFTSTWCGVGLRGNSMSITSQARAGRTLVLATGLVVGLAATLASGESRAYTPEEQQACSPDAFRLCSSEIPDVDRITACMVRNKSQLSPECRAFFRPEPGERAGDAPGRPMRISPAAAEKARAHKVKKPKPNDT